MEAAEPSLVGTIERAFIENEDEVMDVLQFTDDTLEAIDVTAVTLDDLEATEKAVTDLTARSSEP